VLQGHSGPVFLACFSPDGNLLASISHSDHIVRLWDRHTGQCLHVLAGHMDTVRSVSFSFGGEVLASGSSDETIRIWDVRTGECRRILRSEQPYEGMNITEAIGLTPSQVAALKGLGARDDRDQ
jgi:WD40 repeat protein